MKTWFYIIPLVGYGPRNVCQHGRLTLTFKVLPSTPHTHTHACTYTCCPQGETSPSSQVSVPCLEDVFLIVEAANHGHWGFLQNHCSCSHILLWYYSSFDATPSGLGLHFAFKRAEKSPALLWSRDSGLEQRDLCLQGQHKNMKLPNATAK